MTGSNKQYVAFLITLFSMVSSTTSAKQQLRGTKEGRDERRTLYGLEYGKEGLTDIMGAEGRLHEIVQESLPGYDDQYTGPAVLIDDMATGSADGGQEARIVNGEDSNPFPAYAVHLKRTTGWNFNGCGAALISNCHLLTAGHCVRDERAGALDGMYVNAWKPFNGNGGEPFHFTTINDNNIFVIDGYSKAGFNRKDVAIVKMDQCVDMTAYPPMRVADPSYIESHINAGAMATVIGFGDTADNGVSASTLQRAEVPLINAETCSLFYPGHIDVGDHICAGMPLETDSQKRRDACQGDSGGPLLVDADANSPVIVGIVSSGDGCAQLDKPGIYASTADHYDWIKETVCSDSSTDRSIELCSEPTLAPTTSSPTSAPTAAPTPAIVGRDAPESCPGVDSSCESSPCCPGLTCKLSSMTCKAVRNPRTGGMAYEEGFGGAAGGN